MTDISLFAPVQCCIATISRSAETGNEGYCYCHTEKLCQTYHLDAQVEEPCVVEQRISITIEFDDNTGATGRMNGHAGNGDHHCQRPRRSGCRNAVGLLSRTGDRRRCQLD